MIMLFILSPGVGVVIFLAMVQSISRFERGFGVYVHVPYCVHKCSYCDFYSFTDYTTQDFESILCAYKREIQSGAEWVFNKFDGVPSVSSIFFGGGTPSLLPGRHIRQIIKWISDAFPLQGKVEITLEANPETVTHDYCNELLLTKVNRVSLGAQSFKEAHLETLDRLGRRESVVEATRLLWESGFRNLSIDLIFGIPGQTVRDFEDDLEEMGRLPVDHFSAYQLTLKPGHLRYKELPTEDRSLAYYKLLSEKSEALGFNCYEISNYAKPGRACLHNLLYWNGGDFLGIGPSASSRFFYEGNYLHRKQYADVRAYLCKPDLVDSQFERTNFEQTILESVFLELRKTGGLNLKDFQRRYQFDLRTGKKFQTLKKEGLVMEKEGDLLLSPKGRLLADSISSELADI